jgi:integrase
MECGTEAARSRESRSEVVQERLGHSSIVVTLDIYSHVMTSLGREAADRLDALLTDTR